MPWRRLTHPRSFQERSARSRASEHGAIKAALVGPGWEVARVAQAGKEETLAEAEASSPSSRDQGVSKRGASDPARQRPRKGGYTIGRGGTRLRLPRLSRGGNPEKEAWTADARARRTRRRTEAGERATGRERSGRVVDLSLQGCREMGRQLRRALGG